MQRCAGADQSSVFQSFSSKEYDLRANGGKTVQESRCPPSGVTR
jgi:hypothetical protein